MRILFIIALLLMPVMAFAEDKVSKVDDFTLKVETPIIQTATLADVKAKRDKLAQDISQWEKNIAENRVNANKELERLNKIISDAELLGVKEKPVETKEVIAEPVE